MATALFADVHPNTSQISVISPPPVLYGEQISVEKKFRKLKIVINYKPLGG